MLWAVAAVLIAAICVVIYLSTRKVAAIRSGEKQKDVFFGLLRLVLWEANEGLLLLKNKQISSLIYGPRDGGGVRFIYPVFGEEVKDWVPLTLRLTYFEDERVLTRESVPLFIKVALWWRVADLEKYYYSVDKEVHVVGSEDLDLEEATGTGPAPSLRAQKNAAEQWVKALAESCIRKIVSQSSTAFVVSKNASSYLHVDRRHEQLPPPQGKREAQGPIQESATPDVLADEIHDMLEPKVREYGLEIDRVEVQEVRLPGDLQ